MKQQSRLKSYVKRSGRLTNSQKRILEKKEYDTNFFNFEKIFNYQELFNNSNPCILDIGFGDGKLLTSTAKNFQNFNYITVGYKTCLCSWFNPEIIILDNHQVIASRQFAFVK